MHDYGAGASLEIARDGAAPLLVPFTARLRADVDMRRRPSGRVELPEEIVVAPERSWSRPTCDAEMVVRSPDAAIRRPARTTGAHGPRAAAEEAA